jgi:hypothetical protein
VPVSRLREVVRSLYGEAAFGPDVHGLAAQEIERLCDEAETTIGGSDG